MHHICIISQNWPKELWPLTFILEHIWPSLRPTHSKHTRSASVYPLTCALNWEPSISLIGVHRPGWCLREEERRLPSWAVGIRISLCWWDQDHSVIRAHERYWGRQGKRQSVIAFTKKVPLESLNVVRQCLRWWRVRRTLEGYKSTSTATGCSQRKLVACSCQCCSCPAKYSQQQWCKHSGKWLPEKRVLQVEMATSGRKVEAIFLEGSPGWGEVIVRRTRWCSNRTRQLGREWKCH